MGAQIQVGLVLKHHILLVATIGKNTVKIPLAKDVWFAHLQLTRLEHFCPSRRDLYGHPPTKQASTNWWACPKYLVQVQLLSFWSSFLLMCFLEDSRRWLKCLGLWVPGFHLLQPWSLLAFWRVNLWIHSLSRSIFFSLCVSLLPSQTNK